MSDNTQMLKNLFGPDYEYQMSTMTNIEITEKIEDYLTKLHDYIEAEAEQEAYWYSESDTNETVTDDDDLY